MYGTDFDNLYFIKICTQNIVTFVPIAIKVVMLVLIANSPPLKSSNRTVLPDNMMEKSRQRQKSSKKANYFQDTPCDYEITFLSFNQI